MDLLLAPGMRLIRRLGVTGKFLTIGLFLLAPLLVTAVSGWTTSSRHIAIGSKERDGLRLVMPLVRLTAVLADERGWDTAGPSEQLREAIADLDAADAVVGAALGTHAEWFRLRRELVQGPVAGVTAPEATAPEATAPGATAPEATAGTPSARERLQAVDAFLQRVANVSNLVLDPQLDTHYVMIALVDRLPELLITAAAAEQQARAGPRALTKEETQTLTSAGHLLQQALGIAGSSSGWNGLRTSYAAAAAALSAALGQYVRTLESGAGHDLTTVTTSGSALASTLGSALDTLIDRRQQSLAADRVRPVLLAGLALACAGYLGLSLYRATSQDVNAVLRDIHSVTSGNLHTWEPLAGHDEFAQMSQAIRDTSDRLTELLSALRMQATHDELTALPNRTMFMAKLADAVAEHPGQFAVLLADLERFKDVNDSFGHDIGDRLLKTVSVRFHRAAGRRNLVARLGGDEFAVLVQDAPGMLAVQQVIARMQVALAEPVDVDGRQLHVRARMGVALHALGRPSALELIRNADVALSAAKSGASCGVSLFEPAMHDRTRDRTELSGDLVTAVMRKEFSVLYQPLVDVSTGLVKGVEALVRWVHPTRGHISPAVFVALAEASGQIVPLGRWVLHEALQQLTAWHQEFPDSYPLTLDVNLSADQLADPSLPGEVLALIDRTGVDPRQVVLEITESALVRDTETVLQRLRRLSVIGIRLALDDFGTGYSSLSYLRRMPVSVLKIDKSFVDGIENADGQAARLLRHIVGLGVGLGMEIIAEGIESPEQATVLREAGCHTGQGFLWSRPLEADAVAELLRQGGRLPVAAGSDAGTHPGGLATAAGHPAGTSVPRPRDRVATHSPDEVTAGEPPT